MTDVLPVLISEAEIREILRPPTIFEKSTKARPVLQILAKYGTVSGGQLSKIFHDGNLASLGHNPMRGLFDEGYVTARKGLRWKATTNLFTITPKGRAALKAQKK